MDAHGTLVHVFGEKIVNWTIKHCLEGWYQKTQSEEAPEIEHQKNWSKGNYKIFIRKLNFKFVQFEVKRFAKRFDKVRNPAHGSQGL